MAEASKTVEMPVSIDALYKVITNYEKYSEFVDGVHKVAVKARNGNKARVEYAITLLGKDIFYVLDHTEDSPEKMTWEFVESNVLKSNHGGWELKSLGPNLTRVTYNLALDFKIYVPGLVLNGLIKSSLPKMLDNFKARALK